VSATEKWVLDPPEEQNILYGGYHVIYTGKSNNSRITGFMTDEEAHLIAAAPPLYEAAELICDLLERDEQIRHGEIRKLRAALSAARPAPTTATEAK